jgi:hypothetical protein
MINVAVIAPRDGEPPSEFALPKDFQNVTIGSRACQAGAGSSPSRTESPTPLDLTYGNFGYE